MELVPSAVVPNEIDRRCKIAEVRTLQKVWMSSRFRQAETAARNPFLVLWGLEIPKRTRPEGPLRSLSAARTSSRGQKSVGSARSKIRKRKRAVRTNAPPGACHGEKTRAAFPKFFMNSSRNHNATPPHLWYNKRIQNNAIQSGGLRFDRSKKSRQTLWRLRGRPRRQLHR